MSLVKIYVTLKEGILDVQGATILKALKSLGYEDVADVRVGKYLQVKIDKNGDKDEQIKKMCRQLLTNPIIEDYTYEVVD